MKEHLRDVRLNYCKPINDHFGILHHTVDDVQFVILQKLYGASKAERLLHEAKWIKTLRTERPVGCNVKDNGLPAVVQCYMAPKSLQEDHDGPEFAHLN